MNAISTTALETLARSVHEDIGNARFQIRTALAEKVLGKTVEHTHTEEDLTGDGYIRTPVVATVVGTRWTHDNEILLEVTYTHPTTGETIEDECPMW